MVAITILVGVAPPRLAGAVPPRQLVEVVDISVPTISPDGSMVAFRTEQGRVERNTYDTAWYVQPVDGSAPPLRIADGGTPFRNSSGASVPEPPLWSPDGRWIYYRARLDGKVDVWRAATDGSAAEPVTQDAADVHEFMIDAGGRTLTYSVGAPRERIAAEELREYGEGIRIDESVPLGQGLFRSGYLGERPETQRLTGNWFDRGPLLADAPRRWKAIDLGAGVGRHATSRLVGAPTPDPRGTRERSGTVGRGAYDRVSGRTAILTRTGNGIGLSQEPEIQLSVTHQRGRRTDIRCKASLCSGRMITAAQWRPGRDEVVFSIDERDHARGQGIYRWHVSTGEVVPVVRSAGLLSGGRDAYSTCGISSSWLACVAAEAGRPPRLEAIEIDTGQRIMLFDPNESLASGLGRLAPVQSLRWDDASGQSFTGYLFPAEVSEGERPPLFITYYSCQGFLRGGVGDEWPLASLAASGISALCINRVPEFALDAAVRYGHGLSAVESVVDLLASKGEIDPGRVGMGGLSFGSEVALWTTMHSEILSAVSVSSPMLTPTYYLMGSHMGAQFSAELERVWQVGDPSESAVRWQALSPAMNLHRIRIPVLMQMSEQEYMHALDYAIPLIRSRRAELYVFPHEPHLKFQPKHKLAVYQRNLDWFSYWLLGAVDTDPSKTSQYARWNQIRQRTSMEGSHARAGGGDQG